MNEITITTKSWIIRQNSKQYTVCSEDHDNKEYAAKLAAEVWAECYLRNKIKNNKPKVLAKIVVLDPENGNSYSYTISGYSLPYFIISKCKMRKKNVFRKCRAIST